MNKESAKKAVASQTFGEVYVAGRLTLWGVGDLKELLLTDIEKNTDLVIRLSANDEIDIAGVQVLIAARKSAKLRGGNVSLTAVLPESMEDWLNRAGINMEFE